jgi:hypothetical protein
MELGNAFNLTDHLDKSLIISMNNALLRYKLQNPNVTNTDIMVRMQELLHAAHYGITPREMTLGYRKNPDKPGYGIYLKDAGYQFQFGTDLKPVFKNGAEFKFEQTTSGDTPPLIQNPLTSPSYGGATGIIPPVWLDIMIRKTSRYTMAKNLAMTFMMSGLVEQAPIKWTKVSDEVDAGTFTPTAEGRAGVDYNNTYRTHKIDAYKYLLHSGISWEVMVAMQGKIDVQGDVIDDLAQAHALLIDMDYWEGQYSGIVSGKYRRWEGASWGTTDEIPLGAASVLTTNAPKHKLFFDLTTGKTYYPAVGAGNEMKYQSSTLRANYLSPAGSNIFDFIVDLAEMMKNKNRKLEWVALTSVAATMLSKDDRFINSQYKTGNVRFQDETGFMGRVPIGGTSTFVDVWAIPDGALAAKTTADSPALAITGMIFGGEYRKTGIIAPYAPFSLVVDDGFEVVAVDTVNVLRRNDTKVLSSKSVQAVAPWDTEALVLGFLMATAHV